MTSPHNQQALNRRRPCQAGCLWPLCHAQAGANSTSTLWPLRQPPRPLLPLEQSLRTAPQQHAHSHRPPLHLPHTTHIAAGIQTPASLELATLPMMSTWLPPSSSQPHMSARGLLGQPTKHRTDPPLPPHMRTRPQHHMLRHLAPGRCLPAWHPRMPPPARHHHLTSSRGHVRTAPRSSHHPLP